MKLTFAKEDIEAILIAKAKEMGMEVNAVSWDAYSYGRFAEVSFVEPIQFEPIDFKAAA
jgi:hypothetical protein